MAHSAGASTGCGGASRCSRSMVDCSGRNRLQASGGAGAARRLVRPARWRPGWRPAWTPAGAGGPAARRRSWGRHRAARCRRRWRRRCTRTSRCGPRWSPAAGACRSIRSWGAVGAWRAFKLGLFAVLYQHAAAPGLPHSAARKALRAPPCLCPSAPLFARSPASRFQKGSCAAGRSCRGGWPGRPRTRCSSGPQPEWGRPA
jgi:hypothetical protein